MKSILTIPLLFLISIFCCAQTEDFDSLIVSFGPRVGPFYQDSIHVPLIYRGKEFNINLADSSLGFKTKSIVIGSPNSDGSFPLSYSVIYKEHIVSLFEPGSFTCLRLSDFSRNTQFEVSLNKHKFKAFWLIDEKLYGLSKGRFWHLDSMDKWVRTKGLPLKANSKSHLCENNDYIVYGDCNGEWGGTVYFYNRRTKETYFTEATCANTVTEANGGFNVLSKLGHGGGSTELKHVPNPTELPNVKDFKRKRKTVEALGYADSSNHAVKIFDYYWIQMFSRFNWEGKDLYLVHWQERTFLAEIKGNDFIIVDPLFNSDLYTHNPITKKYSTGEVLINLDHYGTGGEREVSLVVIKGKEMIKIDWNNKH
ncbi:hypothetical protein [Rufibacter hautae]|uniref:Uncharacterized protein n=1 Tax=Rufibacter hautae TaxID=2595005 RepID=A0A5B6TKB5_9BACT|nr:hypothetical protein [Rufibacter hautae]KAA3439849.1 hypothetical protein FOA19_04035 [Rufibacter hautae]